MLRQCIAVAVLSLLGCTDDERDDNGPPLRCDAGARCGVLPDASGDAPADTGATACPADRDGKPVILAERLGYPTDVTAPAAAGDPAIVKESVDNGSRLTLVDTARCSIASSEVLDGPFENVAAAGNQLAWLQDGGVRLGDVGSDMRGGVVTLHPALALHLDAEWLYVLSRSSTANDAGAGSEAWIERVPRTRLRDARVESEPWIRIEIEPSRAWDSGRLTGSSARLIASVWNSQAGAESEGPAIRIHRESGVQDVLSADETSHAMFALGADVYAQRAAELLVFRDGQKPATLRRDLETRQLVGVISGYAIAREPSAQLLLALPVDGGAPIQIADEQAAFAGVATAGDDVYWINWARRLMTVRGVPH
jgi:hypothetical protein